MSARHGDATPLDVDLDSVTFAAKWNQGASGRSGAILGFKVDTREAVDVLVAALAAEGVPVQQEPYDAFWGARYAVVSDPDGNGVGIMSPVDPARRHEGPPVVSPPADDAIDVVIEIPTGSRNKYEYDHEKHVIRLDRRLFTATTYPADYGFVPDTLAGDGDPLDALVLVADPTFPGCVVRVRILGMFSMSDEKGVDAKLICVLEHDPQWDGAHDIDDVPEHLRNEIAHFFSIYKDLEPEKSVEVQGFADRPAPWRSSSCARSPTVRSRR